MAEHRTLTFSKNVGDPETLETFYAGQPYTVGEDISEEQADRLSVRFSDSVEDSGSENGVDEQEAQESGDSQEEAPQE